MADPELVAALEVVSGTVNLQPASFVLETAMVPGRVAERARDDGWNKIFFTGGFDERERAFSASMSVARPLQKGELDLLPSEVTDRIETRHLPRQGQPAALLAHIKERDGHIAYVLCTDGANDQDFWSETPAGLDANIRLATAQELVRPTREIIIKDLYEELVDAGAVALAKSLSV